MNSAPASASSTASLVALHLRIDATAGGSWRLAAPGLDGRDEARARLDPRAVRRLRAELDAAGRGDRSAANRAQAAIFEASTGLAAIFGERRGLARARATAVALLIEAQDPAVAALPWTALEHGAAGEAELMLVVAAVAPDPIAADAPRPPRRGPAARFCIAPDGFGARAVRVAIEATCARLDLPAPAPINGAPPPDHAQVLYLAPADVALDALRPDAEPAERAPSAPDPAADLPPDEDRPAATLDDAAGLAAAPLAPPLRRAIAEADLVVLIADRLDAAALAGRALGAGARAVVALAAEPPAALEAFIAALHAALAAGQPLALASAAARRAALAEDAPAAPPLTVAHPAFAAAVLAGPERRPPGWPTPDPDAARLIDAAWRLAEHAGAGFVGLEHLALALLDAPPRPALRRLRYQFGSRRARIEGRLAAFAPRRPPERVPQVTPRLRALGPYLPDGFDPEALWQVIIDHAEIPLRVMLNAFEGAVRRPEGEPQDVTEPSVDEEGTLPDAGTHEPATAIEIVTGPEDGRRVEPAPGEIVGRASGGPGADHRLYDDTDLTDPALSRRHLVWRGPGRLELRATARHPRGAVGPQRLCVGDLLGLTRCTWIRGAR